jgi:hypothetical protein
MSDMADVDSSGPTKASIALITILGLPVVLVLLFLVVGRIQSGQSSTLPDLRTKGLKWAQTRSQEAGFSTVTTHDALGRDRSPRDAKAWKVCFQVPEPGDHARKTDVQLGVVRVSETCPTTDQGRIQKATATMPNLVNRTAYMVTVSLGEDASVRFISAASQREITSDLGDYRICSQEPKPNEPFDGVPVKAVVVPYSANCDDPPKTALKNTPKSALATIDVQSFYQRILDLIPG